MPSLTKLEKQPLETPLNDAAVRALENLLQEKSKDRRLEGRLAKAVTLLTDVVGPLNDRAYEEKTRYLKRQSRLRENGQDEEEEEREAHETFQHQVETLTNRMDTSIRKVIDDRAWLDGLPDAIRQATTNSSSGLPSTLRTTQSSTQDPPSHAQSSRRPKDYDLDEDEDEDLLLTAQVRPAESPSALLGAALAAQETAWNHKTLTQRYAYDNDYAGFYRVIYDTQNPSEHAPPVPHPDTWFANEEGRPVENSQGLGPGAETDEESDLEIASERLRIKCPITYLPYRDPVTSVKCKHSYEKSAILEMLESTAEYVPWTPEQLAELSQASARDRVHRERWTRIPQVKCPECNIPLTKADLRPNPALQRRVRRILDAQKSQDNATSDIDEEEQDNGASGTQRNLIGLDSSPVPSARHNINIKDAQTSSFVPQTQLPSRSQMSNGSAIMELGDEEMDIVPR